MQWSWWENGGQYSETGYIVIQPEGTGVHRSWGAQDLAWEVSDARRGELPSAQHYEDCLIQSDDLARFDCLRDPVITEPTICDEGWLAESI